MSTAVRAGTMSTTVRAGTMSIAVGTGTMSTAVRAGTMSTVNSHIIVWCPNEINEQWYDASRPQLRRANSCTQFPTDDPGILGR